jgi:hypothetical protein
MKAKELIDLLEKFPKNCEVIYDGTNQLANDNQHLESTKDGDDWPYRDFDGRIDDFYIDNVEDLNNGTSTMLLCLTAKPKEKVE